MSNPKPHRQYGLISGTEVRTCWLPADKRLVPGVSLKLRGTDDPDNWWTVVHVGTEVRNLDELHTDWHNNI